jgi:hypothetical protein
LFSQALLSRGSLEDRFVEKRGQVVRVNIGTQNNRTASSAIAAIRSSFGHESFSAERHATIATATGKCLNPNVIYKHENKLCYAFACWRSTKSA